MSLDYALLGFLNYGPMTGYELKKTLDESTQFFWHAELSQIYPVLKHLEEKGWIVSETQPQGGKPDKKIYSIAPPGHAALLDWLSDPIDAVPAIKNTVLLKLFFAGALDKASILAQLRAQLKAQKAQLQRFQDETAAHVRAASASEDLARPALMWELVRQYGEAQVLGNIAWLEQALAAVEQSEEFE